MKKVIIIYGPTAVGKSGIAIELAKLIDGEIISADSMQIYKHLNIGSAKVTPCEMQGIPHYLIDIKEPNEDYSVAEFVSDANYYIDKIISNNKTPIIVGGTGLYIKGLISNYSFGNSAKNVELRQSLDNLTTEELYNTACSFGGNINVDKNNRRRLIRYIEKQTNGNFVNNNSVNIKYPYLLFGICDDRQLIYDRINSRVNKMVDDGLIDELNQLLSIKGIENSLCMKAIGYKELIPYVNGEATLNDCLNILKQKTRNYAKRQITYMNQFDNIIKINFCGTIETSKKIYEYIHSK